MVIDVFAVIGVIAVLCLLGYFVFGFAAIILFERAMSGGSKRRRRR